MAQQVKLAVQVYFGIQTLVLWPASRFKLPPHLFHLRKKMATKVLKDHISMKMQMQAFDSCLLNYSSGYKHYHFWI